MVPKFMVLQIFSSKLYLGKNAPISNILRNSIVKFHQRVMFLRLSNFFSIFVKKRNSREFFNTYWLEFRNSVRGDIELKFNEFDTLVSRTLSN